MGDEHTRINDFELHYSYYSKGSFFKRHVDQFKNNNSRKFSMIIYLNPFWEKEDSGELKLYLKDDLSISPTMNKCVLFRSEMIEHEVLPSNAESRLSITIWLKQS